MAGGISGVIGGSSIPLKSSLCMLSFLSIILYYILPKISYAHTHRSLHTTLYLDSTINHFLFSLYYLIYELSLYDPIVRIQSPFRSNFRHWGRFGYEYH